ncbi:MAG: BspA family leucine-rich repeat surface protein [Bacteroidota bacterium]
MSLFNALPLALLSRFTVVLIMLLTAHCAAAQLSTTDFVTTWKTDNTGPSCNSCITIPVTGGGYDVDWDNDGVFDQFGLSGNVSHDFGTPGIYTIRIRGSFLRINFNNKGDREKIMSIDQWGNITWITMRYAFLGCTNLGYTATDNPDLSSVSDMLFMFGEATSFNGDISGWNTTQVSLMSHMFYGATAFNQDISGWNTENVTDMSAMFEAATAFNRDIGGWNVENVKDMTSMFRKATSFNQNIGGWNIEKLSNMYGMLDNAGLDITNYGNTLIGWAAQKVKPGIWIHANGLKYCLGETARNILTSAPNNWRIFGDIKECNFADAFITTWVTTTPNETITIPTTGGGYNYDVDWGDNSTSTGLTGNATHTYATPGPHKIKIIGDFPRIYSNNGGDKDKIQSIDQWGNIAWTSMGSAFRGCSNLGYTATDNPDLTSVTDMSSMFAWATSFDGDIGGWKTDNVTNMALMFTYATSFNGDIGGWKTDKVTNMAGMFDTASSFNQDISGWKTDKVINMRFMFSYATAFNQEIGGWNTENVTNMEFMFWLASSFNGDIGGWKTDNVTTMTSMFENATAFDRDISGWKTDKVISLAYMFYGATSFNQDIGGWNTDNVKFMDGVFGGATSFNQDIGGWNVENVTSLNHMLDNTAMDITNYDNTLIGWAAQPVRTEVSLGANGLKYCLGETARNTLITGYNLWDISGDALAASDADAGPDQTVCAANVTLAANAPTFGTGMWSEVAGDGQGMFGNAADHNTTFTGTPGVAYTLRWTITGGTCSKTDEVVITLENSVVTVAVTPTSVAEDGSVNLIYTFSRNCAANAITVNFGVAGTAAFSTDYNQSGATTYNATAGTVTMGAGVSSIDVIVDPTPDMTVELDETVELTVQPGAGYTVGAPNTATGTIGNDDQAVISITSPSITEGNTGDNPILNFEISMSQEVDANVDFNYTSLSGTATVNIDYQNPNGSHTLSPGEQAKQIGVTVNGDCEIEIDEDFVLQLFGLNAGGRNVTFSSNLPTLDGTGTILNDDALPEITCPGDQTQGTDAGLCSASVTLGVPTTSSICGADDLEFRTRTVDQTNNPTGPWTAWISAANNVRTFAVGKYEVEWSIDDNSGSSYCSYYVTINDTEIPIMVCQNMTVSLNNDGNRTITPGDVYDAANSSDNCGTINLVSVSPNQFTCLNEGANTVTLTADDGNGNSATCDATVTVDPFITGYTATHTNETCSGAADGTIALSASSPGGQIGYSIDGGVNYQFNGSFVNLNPGTYDIVLKVFGVPAICELYAVDITISAGTNAQTWYKDMDGDGHSDGINLMACTQPPGYHLANDLQSTDGDCNDNDADEFPGQAWYDDQDGDGFGSGNWQNACQRPVGCFTAAELQAVSGDCNDQDDDVHPGATEVCNGIDDDCDGEIDEGTTGGLTWTGNVAFYTQADVDAFSRCYAVIDGSVTIIGTNITNLSNLSNLEEITGNLTIQSTGLTSMVGLDNLLDVGGTLTIYFNSSLTTLDGLDALGSVGSNLMVYYNFTLSDGCAIYNLVNGGVSGGMSIFFNAAGCNSVAEINANCGPNNLAANPNSNQFNSLEPGNILNDEKGLGQIAIKVFPNPAATNTTVQFDQTISSGWVRVADITGRIVKEKPIVQEMSQLKLDLHTWKPGTYFIMIEAAGRKLITKKLTVINNR